MIRVSAQIQEVARRAVEYEAGLGERGGARIGGALLVCDKLRRHLTPLIGALGYGALMARTLGSLKRENGWAEEIVSGVNGALEMVQLPWSGRSGEEGSPDPEELPARLLGFLATLIGEVIVLKLVHEVWPEVHGVPSDKREAMR